MRTLIRNCRIVTMADDHCVESGDILIEDDRLVQVGGELPVDMQADEIINGQGKLYMPGLVNTHGHAAMSLLRGYADDKALQVWLEQYMWPMEGKFTAQDVRIGAELAILEMIKGGTTTFVDMYDYMNEVALAVEQSGIRGCLTRGVIGLCSAEEQTAKLQEAMQFAKDWNGKAAGRITTMMSPHAPYTCPPDYIERIVDAASQLDLPIHIHMSETKYEVEQHKVQYERRPVQHLLELGVFDRPCIVAHAVHLNDEEISILQEKDVRVSHNPGSNLKLASGVARIPDLLRAGVKVSLGTDSAASNNNLDMFEEMRLAALLHKGVSYDPTVIPAVTALRMGTVDGAQSIWLDDIGTLQAGMKADLIAVDMNQAHFAPYTDFISHVIYSASAKDVTDVWVDGRQIVKSGQSLTLDEERILYEAQRCFERLNG